MGWVGEWVGGGVDERTSGWKDEDGCMNGRTDGSVDGRQAAGTAPSHHTTPHQTRALALPRTDRTGMGQIPMTAIERSKPVLIPALFVAVTVYVVAAEAAVGVPVMCPVDVSNAKPPGRAGETAYVVAAPPDMVGELVPIAKFTA